MLTFTMVRYLTQSPREFIRITCSDGDKVGGRIEILAENRSKERLAKLVLDTLIQLAEEAIDQGNSDWCVVTVGHAPIVVHNYGQNVGLALRDLLKDYAVFDAP